MADWDLELFAILSESLTHSSYLLEIDRYIQCGVESGVLN